MRSRTLVLVVAVALAAAACTPTERDVPEETRVLAEVNGRELTLADVDARIADVPRLARPEYSGPIGRTRMLRRMVEEEVLYQAAVDAGTDRAPDVVERLENLKRQTVVQSYLDHVEEEASRVSAEEARAFYDEHLDEYRTEKMVRVRMLLTDREKVAKHVQEICSSGTMGFADACAKHSEDPFVVSARGLVPTWIRQDRAVPWIGNHPEFHDVVFSLERDQLSDPFETMAGWHVVRVEDVRESRQRPFDEVEADVTGRIARERSTRGLPELLAELNERYGVVIHEEPGTKSADELFAEAQAAPDPRMRVKLYGELVERFPTYDRALDAHFMIGFIHSEELKDVGAAEVAFRKVIELDPDSDLAKSAEWMLTSGNDDPPFEDDGWEVESPTESEEGTP